MIQVYLLIQLMTIRQSITVYSKIIRLQKKVPFYKSHGSVVISDENMIWLFDLNNVISVIII